MNQKIGYNISNNKTMKNKTYTIHVGAYFTADIQVKAESKEQAEEIAANYDFCDANFEFADTLSIEVTE